MGTPKALLRGDDGEPWVVRAADDLLAAGCDPVVVVLGAARTQAQDLLAADPRTSGVEVVPADDWAEGIGHSLRAGLEHLGRASGGVDAVMVMLVDLPDIGEAVLERVSGAWARAGSPARLLRATYDGRPGHPVVLGRDHWGPLVVSLRGDVGAQAYLTRVDIRRRVEGVECADLATGRDVDRPSEEQG